MSGPAEEFGEDTARFEMVQRAECGDYLHEYTGVLAETNKQVRILTLAPSLAENDDAVDAFTRVSDQWYGASANGNILTIQARDKVPRPWIAVPDNGGDTLATVHDDFSAETIESIIGETAEALRTIGLYNTVHGHLSPTDIYVTTSASETTAVQVGGFGLEAAIRSAVGESNLTPYTAPELVNGSTQPTEQTDVYGLGAVTYFALTGQPPVTGTDLKAAIRKGPTDPPSAYVEDITANVDDVVMQALSANPADRYDSPYAFYRAFLSAFDPTDFAGDEETVGESETNPVGEKSTASSEEPTDGPRTAGETTADMEDSSSTTRRAALGVLGLCAVGGAGTFFLQKKSSIPEMTNQQTDQPTTDTEQSSPTITSLSLSNPTGQELRTSFESDERLATIRVRVSDTDSDVLLADDFTEQARNGVYTYEATYQASSAGNYTATLEDAIDGTGNDVAAGQSASVTVGTAGDALSITFNNPASLDEWDNVHSELELTQQPVYEGQSSASIRTSGVSTVAQIDPFNQNRQMQRFTYYWHEGSASFGGGVALETTDGELEVFAGTNNPEWTVINGFDEDRQTVYEGDGYDRWIRTDFTFDWESGTVTTAFTDLQTASSENLTVDLASGTGIGRIRLVGFTSARYPDEGFYTGSCYMRWDNIQISL
ncbi:protein kinase domain-containing protein [Haloarcula laminariae]|uniref:protein kinase domain-containing protein n=1 Tax=Haloarcula laminariae TaxID=2961577 RepID=UPI0024059D9D|nr:hypothetical protein [Halomicroarcula sp. FL173]